jgi:hypothetical protein
VYVSATGISFLKEISSAGNYIGSLRLMSHRLETIKRYGSETPTHGYYGKYTDNRWTLDPGHIDSILLDQPYDPVGDIKVNSKLFADINRHNKAVSIQTRDTNVIRAFFMRLKPGDKFWTSPIKVFVVQTVFKDDVGHWRISALDANNETKLFTAKDLQWKRLYKEQPRSFSAETKN